MSPRRNNGLDGFGLNLQIGLVKVYWLMLQRSMNPTCQIRTVTMVSRTVMYAVASDAAIAVAPAVERARAVRPNAASAAFEPTIVDAAKDPRPVLWTHHKNQD